MIKLIWVALLSDLLTPMLISRFGWPPAIRWISPAVLVIIVVPWTIWLLLKRERAPKAIFLMFVISIVGVIAAWSNGSGVSVIAWGAWLMMRGPLIGLFSYLKLSSLERFPQRWIKWNLLLLGLEVGVQIWQFLTGTPPGDSLAGTLGDVGTQHLAMITIWVLAVCMGDWVARGRLVPLLGALGLSAVSAVLAELKIFFFAAPVMGLIAIGFSFVKKRRLAQTLLLIGTVVLALLVSVQVYDAIVPSAQLYPLEYYLDPASLSEYANYWGQGVDKDDLGRNLALSLVWQRISISPPALLFGEGLGARAQSDALGLTGAAIIDSEFGLFVGTSLVVILDELGLMGLLVLGGFFLWALRTLWKSVAIPDQQPGMVSLEYGLIIYTLLWPVLLWYASAWVFPASTMLYWVTLGYVLGQSRKGRSVSDEFVTSQVQPHGKSLSSGVFASEHVTIQRVQ
jgi:hypothetical protein